MSKLPFITFKRGDTFKLDLTVTDKLNDTAVAAKVALDAANAAEPQVTLDISNAQAAYDAAIIVDITNWTIISHVRWRGKLVTTLSVVIANAATGILSINATSTQTKDWEPRDYACDIEFIPGIGAGTISSQTFLIKVEKDQSYV